MNTYTPGLPNGIQTAIERALAKDPSDRYASAGEFADALSATVAQGVTPANTPEKRNREPIPQPRLPIPIVLMIAGIGTIFVCLILAWVIASNLSKPSNQIAGRATETSTLVATVIPSTTPMTVPTLASVVVSVPTTVPTPTSTVSATPIVRPTIAATQTPVVIVVTATPVPPTSVPTQPTVYPAPNMLSVQQGGGHVHLEWLFATQLGTDEYFEALVWKPGVPSDKRSIGWTKDRYLDLNLKPWVIPSLWNWAGGSKVFCIVKVIQGRDGKWLGDLSAESNVVQFGGFE